MKRTPHALPIIAASLLCGCITLYTPPFLEDHQSLLAVEAIITDGETTVRLSRSIGLNSVSDASMQWVSGAQVWIESENGERFDALGSASGEYIAAGVTLSNDVRYRLRISWNGREYESSYRYPQSTPPIYEIDFHQRREGEPLQVRLDVMGESDGSRHYLWSYEETWEVRARMMASHYFGYNPGGDTYSYQLFLDGMYSTIPEEILSIFEYPNGVSSYYYCWKYDKSKEILLADTERLTSNTLKDHVLYEIPLTDDRISALYHTKIYLYSIAEDAYNYYANQKKNTDQTGSIFAPIPSEMQGNIVCTTSPDIPVIGFVDVSRRTERDIFMDSYDYPFYQRPYHDCTIYENEGLLPTLYLLDKLEDNEKFPDALYMLSFNDYPPPMPPRMTMTYRECIDCRLQGGSKLRPEWWPADHF